MPDVIGIASLSRYNSCASLEIGLHFVCDVIKGNLIVECAKQGNELMLSDLVYHVRSTEIP